VGVQPKKPTVKGPTEWFTGDVWIDSIVQQSDHSTLNVGAVHFTPEARSSRCSRTSAIAGAYGGKPGHPLFALGRSFSCEGTVGLVDQCRRDSAQRETDGGDRLREDGGHSPRVAAVF
jgi:hypothetical protein